MTGPTKPTGGDSGDIDADEARRARATAAARARRMGSRPRPGPRPVAETADLSDEPPEAPAPAQPPARSARTRRRGRASSAADRTPSADDDAADDVANDAADDAAEGAAEDASPMAARSGSANVRSAKPTPAPANAKPKPAAAKSASAAAAKRTPAPAAQKGPKAGTKTTVGKAADSPTRPRPGVGARARGKTRVGEAGTRSDSAKGASADRSARFGRLRPWAGALAAGVLALILAAAAAVLLTTRPARVASAKDRTVLLSSVKSSTALILSYDYRKLPANIDAASPHLTGDYKNQYLQAMAQTVTPKAKAQKAVVTGQVDGAGVETVNKAGTLATVLVLGELNYTSTTVTQGRTDVFRIRVTAQLVKGKWLISKIDTL